MTALIDLIGSAGHFVSAAQLLVDAGAGVPATATADRDVLNQAWVALSQAISSEDIRTLLSGPELVRVLASHPPQTMLARASLTQTKGRTAASPESVIIPSFAVERGRE